MTTAGERRKGIKHVRVHGGKTRVHAAGKKCGRHVCALCGGILHGVAHKKSKAEILALPKSKRRPEAVYGGVLCAGCRHIIAEDAAKVSAGFKELGSVSYRTKPYVEGMVKRTGGMFGRA